MNRIKKLFKESINIKQEILNSNILNVIARWVFGIRHNS